MHDNKLQLNSSFYFLILLTTNNKYAIFTYSIGESAVFKALVKGDPKPEVSWRRAKGNISDKNKFLIKCDESTGEHILQVTQDFTRCKNPVCNYCFYM